MLAKHYDILIVGGEDIHLRVPYIKELKNLGLNVGVVGSLEYSLEQIFQDNHIDYYYYPLKRSVTPVADLYAQKKLEKIVMEQRPKIIHGFDTKPALWVSQLARKITGLKAIRTINGLGYVFSSNEIKAHFLRPFMMKFQKKASQSAEWTIFQNPDDYQFFLDHKLIGPQKGHIIKSSGIDVDFFDNFSQTPQDLEHLKKQLNIDSHKKVVTLVSRMIKSKGIFYFLEAAREILKTRDDVTFLLVGPLEKGPQDQISSKMLDEYLGQDIFYLGPRNDVPSLLKISDIFVLPSFYREGIPRALLEAGISKLPLITTDVPGCREAVQNGHNGLLIPPRSAEELIKALVKLLDNHSLCLEMGENSYHYVKKNFSLKNITQQYCKLYEPILHTSA